MKRFLAILLTLTLLMGLGTSAVLAKPSLKSNTATTTLPDKSTYQFSYVLPDYVVTDKDATVGVNLKTAVKGSNGYDDAYIKFAAAGPASVDFSKDSSNTYANQGTLDAFNLAAQYDTTTNWTLKFSKDGTYQITFQLFDADDNELTKKTQEIKVADGAFVFTVPQAVTVNTEAAFETRLVTAQAYEDVHFAFAKTSGAGDVIFKALDTDNASYTFTNSGDLKPAGLDIAQPYSATNAYKLTFSQDGTYKIAFKLVDSENNVLLTGSKDVVVKKAQSDDEDEDEDEDKDDEKDGQGNTHGLLNALRNHLIKKNANSNSTQRLMELLESRGVDLTELKAAIAELETALANLDLTDDNFKALAKMKELDGKKYETYIDGKKVNYEDAEPVLEKGRTMVPFRKLAEILGAQVNWDNAKRQITVIKDGKTVIITLDKNTATVDGKTVTLDVPAKIYKNRTLVPLRFLAESLNTTVDYYPEGALISIKKHDK